MIKPFAVGMALLAGLSALDTSALNTMVAEARDKARPGPGQGLGPRLGPRLGYAKACSRYGNGCVSGPVRPARFGHQVRLKSGTWIDCKGDCGQALLEDTVDFWDSQADKARVAVP